MKGLGIVSLLWNAQMVSLASGKSRINLWRGSDKMASTETEPDSLSRTIWKWTSSQGPREGRRAFRHFIEPVQAERQH